MIGACNPDDIFMEAISVDIKQNFNHGGDKMMGTMQ